MTLQDAAAAAAGQFLIVLVAGTATTLAAFVAILAYLAGGSVIP